MSTHFLHAHLARSASGRSRTPKRHQDATPSFTAGGASVDALYAATELYVTLCTWPRLRDLSLRSALAFGVGRRTVLQCRAVRRAMQHPSNKTARSQVAKTC